MAEWRLGRGWSLAEKAERLSALESCPTNFEEDRQDEMTPEAGWHAERSASTIAREAPGEPVAGGPFERARAAMIDYRFSDPDVVTATFDPRRPLLGRRMLLELKVLGLRYLSGTVVGAVRDEQDARQTRFAYRYDTLRGHIERGSEWFELDKDHASGEVRFCIRSRWREGEFPNAWSRAGFAVLGPRYRAHWLERAHARLRLVANHPDVHPETPERRGETNVTNLTTSEIDTDHPISAGGAYALSAGFGALSGVRSMTGPAAASIASAIRSTSAEAPVQHALGTPAAVATTVTLALGEMVADKHPCIPARTDAPSVAGRMGMGAVAGAGAARRMGRHGLVGALLGSMAAATSTYLSHTARARLAARFEDGSVLPGLIEDAFVVAAGAALVGAATRSGAP